MREENRQKELERQWEKIQLNSHYGQYGNSFIFDMKEAERIAEEGRRLMIKNKRNQVIDELLFDNNIKND